MPTVTQRKLALSAAIYAVIWRWRNGVLRNAVRTGGTIGPKWLRILVCRMLQQYAHLCGVQLASESGPGLECDQSRRYMVTWHPHGMMVFCPITLMAEKSIVGVPQGAEWHCTGAPVIFQIPGLGETLMLVNGRPVDKRSLESILGKGGQVAIQPGGMAEQAITRHDQEQAVFPKNLGFIRLAIQTGTPMLMLYVFGENQLFKRVDGMEWLTKLIHRTSGLMFPMWTGKFGIPQVNVPLKTNVHARWGNPVEVGPAEPNPSDERVEEVFQRYLLELQRLFYSNCHDCLPPEVAEKGLKIIRLDGKPVPAFPQSVEGVTTVSSSSVRMLIEQEELVRNPALIAEAVAGAVPVERRSRL